MASDFEDGDVPPPSQLDSFDGSGKWPTFKIQTAQDDLRVRASQRKSKRAAVETARAEKASRLRKEYERKLERVKLFKESQESLKRKVRDLNAKQAQDMNQLRAHLSTIRSKGMGALTSSGLDTSSTSSNALGQIHGQMTSTPDALSLLRQSLESSLGLHTSQSQVVSGGSSFSPSNSAIPRARTAGSSSIKFRRRREQSLVGQSKSRTHKNDGIIAMSQSRGPKSGSSRNGNMCHIPDGSSFYEFAESSKVGSTAPNVIGIDSLFDISKQNPQENSALAFEEIGRPSTVARTSRASSKSVSKHNSCSSSSSSKERFDSAQQPQFLTSSSLLDFSSTWNNRIRTETDSVKTDAETGEAIVLNSVASLPPSWSPQKRFVTGDVEMMEKSQSSSNLPTYSISNSRRPATTLDSGGSSLGGSMFFDATTHNHSISKSSGRPPRNILRAQTAGPGLGGTRSGFLRGPDARRMMARRAKHASLGQLAPRDMMFPKPTTFWQKEWATHSKQYQTQSSVHQNGRLLREGLRHISDLRQRQMQDMERLLKIERDKEIERQARAVAEKDPARLRRLHEISLEERERSRDRILRIAREHELSLASRMASLGVIR